MWAQKSFGLWTTYGGGGYRVNPGPQGINSWFAGWGIERRLGDRLQLGTEIYHETAEARGEKANSGVNFGAIFDFNDTYHLLGSAGPRTSDCCRGTALAYYLALAWTPGT